MRISDWSSDVSSSDLQTAAVAAPDPIDVAIGSRLRLRRLAMGFSQETLARALGITFQQIQKYERGTNRIFASRLFHLARVLRVPVAYFFHGLQDRKSTRLNSSH